MPLPLEKYKFELVLVETDEPLGSLHAPRLVQQSVLGVRQNRASLPSPMSRSSTILLGGRRFPRWKRLSAVEMAVKISGSFYTKLLPVCRVVALVPLVAVALEAPCALTEKV